MTPTAVPRIVAAAPAPVAMLQVSGLQVAYGDVQALWGVDFEVPAGRIVALLGANGAGKTTTLRAISGLLRPRAGRLRFDGQDLARLAPHAIVALGLGHIPEGRRLWPGMTVRENLELGAFPARARPHRQAGLEWVLRLFPRLAERQRQLAGTLSGGEQQMLAIGRALMARPRLLMLDEPSLGLAPLVVAELFAIVREDWPNSVGIAPGPGSEHFRFDALVDYVAFEYLPRTAANVALTDIRAQHPAAKAP